MSECLFVISIWSTFAIFSDDTVLGYCSYGSNYTETYFCGYIQHFYQRIIVGTVAKDSHYNAFCSMGIYLSQVYYCQCWNKSGKYRHGYSR